MKRCPSCREVKALDEFHRLARSKDGHQGYCKICANRKRREWARANPEKNDQWKRDSARRMTTDQRYDKRLRSHFKMTLAEYEVRLAQQGGVCAACKRPPDGRRLHVDHDHSCCDVRWTCGRCVRGLVCINCNAALGHVNDSKERLMSLIEYLNTPGQCSAEFLK